MQEAASWTVVGDVVFHRNQKLVWSTIKIMSGPTLTCVVLVDLDQALLLSTYSSSRFKSLVLKHWNEDGRSGRYRQASLDIYEQFYHTKAGKSCRIG